MKRWVQTEPRLVNSDAESFDESPALPNSIKIDHDGVGVDTHFEPTSAHGSTLQVLSRTRVPSLSLSPIATTKRETPTSLPKSSLRQRKRKLLMKYRDCMDLVDPQLDSSIASDYETLLFTHMTMVTGSDPCFRCSCCPANHSSTFICKTLCDLVDTIPKVEQHLLECSGSPTWLAAEIIKAKTRHSAQSCPRKPYSHLIWKRVLAHAVYNRIPSCGSQNKKVKFSDMLCHERIIPARVSQPDASAVDRCC